MTTPLETVMPRVKGAVTAVTVETVVMVRPKGRALKLTDLPGPEGHRSG